MTSIFFAQNERELTPGISVDGEISQNEIAQVYTYTGTTAEVIKLTLISGDGLALGILVTDVTGNQIAQQTDEPGNGFLVVDGIEIAEDGTYYVTIFPLAVADSPTQGSFSISLALSNQVPSEDDTSVTTEEPVEQAVTATPEATEESVVTSITPGEILTDAGIQISLGWNTTVDLNIEVRDPSGGSIYWDLPNSDSGGFFDGFNANGSCETFTANNPTESVRWSPGAVPTGSYEILVFYVQDCEANGAIPFSIDITVDGQPYDEIRGTTLQGQVFISSFEISDTGDVVIRDGGISQTVLPATTSELTSSATPIGLNTEVTGVIGNDTPFQTYSFQANAGDIVSAQLDATSGSLDAFLFLIDELGNQLVTNDDANDQTRNAAISSQLIDADGTYTIVATRYGQRIGGTEGNFNLSLSTTSVSVNLGEELRGIDLPDGIIEVSLLWETNADLQLLVRDPAGDAVFDDEPVITSGGRLASAGNVGCVISDTQPISYTYWPVGQRVRPGTYEVDVWFQSACNDNTPVTATLAIVIGGEVVVSDSFTPLLDDHYITTFTIGTDGSIVRGLGGISGGSETIDYTIELATAPALITNVPVTGNIADDDRFDVYVFNGSVGDTVTLRMDATAGTLDTLIFLLGPTGVELASNDDAIPGETTNSLISEFTLPQNGQYIVLATHYGTVYGGTNGIYSLTLALSSSN